MKESKTKSEITVLKLKCFPRIRWKSYVFAIISTLQNNSVMFGINYS